MGWHPKKLQGFAPGSSNKDSHKQSAGAKDCNGTNYEVGKCSDAEDCHEVTDPRLLSASFKDSHEGPQGHQHASIPQNRNGSEAGNRDETEGDNGNASKDYYGAIPENDYGAPCEDHNGAEADNRDEASDKHCDEPAQKSGDSTQKTTGSVPSAGDVL